MLNSWLESILLPFCLYINKITKSKLNKEGKYPYPAKIIPEDRLEELIFSS